MAQKSKLEELLAEIHTGLAQEFLNRILSGEASPADLNAARQFLKDNYITSVPKKDEPFGQLIDTLPFSTEGEQPGPRKH